MKGQSIKYTEASKEELIYLLEEKNEIIKQLKNEKNEAELLSFPWTGNLGQWHWAVQSNEVIFNEKKATTLGYEREEIPEEVGFEYFTSKLHPDDYDRVMDNMRNHLMNVSDAYEVEYRIQKKDGSYIWYYDRGKVTSRDENGEPITLSGIVFDIDENKVLEEKLKKANEKLKRLALTDELTGAYNRRYMIERINSEIERQKQTNSYFSLLLFDVDKLKFVNDSFGHHAGDRLLKKTVEVSMNQLRKMDILARWGGDEFVILLPDTPLSEAVLLAKENLEELNKTTIEGVNGITVSVGVSSYCEGDTAETVIKRADQRMYQSKFDGGNRIEYED